jgi:hypothetical protein
LHHFNPWHWPGWYAVNFWLVFAGLLAALILKNDRVQAVLRSFYASRFWHTVKSRIKKSKPNLAVVRFCLRKRNGFLRTRIGKRLLRKWVIFWKNVRVERYPVYALMFAFLAVFIVFFRCSALTETPRAYLSLIWLRRFIYYNIYTPYYLGPLVEFNISGAITWRLFIAPATGLLLIVWLLRVASKSKKKKRKAP